MPYNESHRFFWEVYACKVYPLMAKAAVRLLSMHVSTCASECNWSIWGKEFSKDRNRLGSTLGEQIVFICGNLKGGCSDSDDVVLADLFK
jgi:hypothetical protein